MNLRHEILITLKKYYPYLLPQNFLFDEVNLRIPRPITLDELKEELQNLNAECLIVSVRDELTDALKWKITDEGRAILAAKR